MSEYSRLPVHVEHHRGVSQTVRGAVELMIRQVMKHFKRRQTFLFLEIQIVF